MENNKKRYGAQSDKLDLGQILKDSFAMFFVKGPHLLAIALINFLPLILLGAAAYFLFSGIETRTDLENQLGTMGVFLLGGVALLFICGYMTTASFTHAIFQKLKEDRIEILSSVRVGLASLMTVLGVVFFSSLAIMGGFLLLIVPGIIMSCMLYVAIPVAVVEKAGVIESLKRSRELTYGYKGYIFALMFILNIFSNIAFTVAEAFLKGAGPLPAALVTFGLLFLTYAVGCVASVLIYYSLRNIKESIELEDIVKIFE